jgi:hypothetical protein
MIGSPNCLKSRSSQGGNGDRESIVGVALLDRPEPSTKQGRGTRDGSDRSDSISSGLVLSGIQNLNWGFRFEDWNSRALGHRSHLRN